MKAPLPVALRERAAGEYEARRPGRPAHTLRLVRGRWVCDCESFWWRRRCPHAEAAAMFGDTDGGR